MSRLTRDGTAEPVSRDQILSRERGQGNIIFLCSADHEQDWQPYPVDPYSCCMCDHTYIFLKKSEHPPVRGGNVKTFRWDHGLQIQNLFVAFKRVPRW